MVGLVRERAKGACVCFSATPYNEQGANWRTIFTAPLKEREQALHKWHISSSSAIYYIVITIWINCIMLSYVIYVIYE